MIPVVEHYISEVLQDGLQSIKNNPNNVARRLGMSADRVSRLASYLSRNEIKVIRGYPRTPATVPCFCILLSGEEETQESLGDYAEDDTSGVSQTTEEIIVQTDKEGNLFFRTKYKPITNLISIVHNDFSTPLALTGFEIGNVYKGDVLCYDGMVEDGDSLTVEYAYNEVAIESVSTMFDMTFRIEAWSTNADQVVELYHLCKSILLSGRDYLGDDKKLYRQKLSGGDFEPAPNFFPDFVYRRALNFWCQVGVSAPSGESHYITDVEVNGKLEGDTGELNIDGSPKGANDYE